MALAVAMCAAYGVFLCVSRSPTTRRRRLALAVRPELAAVVAVTGVVGGALGFALFGGAVPTMVVAGCAAAAPYASDRSRRARRTAHAREAWPRLIEEMRVVIGSLGRSIPQALIEVGARAPDEMQGAFEAARREWLLSTDFVQTVAVLKRGLADPTADAACETLLVAHEVGGSDVDRRLAALAEDRARDIQERRDCRSRQAGVVFARRFVLLVPLGMAVAGLGIGDGRAAFATASGQLAVVAALMMIAVCWAWAGRLLRMPAETRVFP